MRRLLIMLALALAAPALGAGAAAADGDRRCVPGDEPISALSEARLATLLQAAAQPDARCVAGLGGGPDCRVGNSDGAPGPAGTWASRSVQPWLPPQARAIVDGSARVGWLDDLRVTLCDGYARGVDRPPRS